MKPHEELRRLVRDWLRKADLDCDVAPRLVSEGHRFRDRVAFHAQQAVEKYLKSILVYHQAESPRTHDIERLLRMLRDVEPSVAEGLAEVKWLTPFGVDIRYPGDFPKRGREMRLGHFNSAQLARRTAMLVQSSFIEDSVIHRPTETKRPKTSGGSLQTHRGAGGNLFDVDAGAAVIGGVNSQILGGAIGS
jgi:HEPN domain-containing protein